MVPFEAILYYLILVDAVFANVAAWSGYGASLNRRFSVFARFFPITKGWTLYYLVLVLWVGSALLRLGVLFY